MTDIIFGTQRHPEPGEWVQFSALEEVAGISFHLSAVRAFCRLVAAAEKQGLRYGVELERDPGNVHDPNAMRVIGKVARKAVFGSVTADRFHIGFVPAALAAQVREELVDTGKPFAAALYSIKTSDRGFIDIKFFVLGPPGSSHSARMRRLKIDS